jgi:hypothetical protein
MVNLKTRIIRLDGGLCVDCPNATVKRATRGQRCDGCASRNREREKRSRRAA